MGSGQVQVGVMARARGKPVREAGMLAGGSGWRREGENGGQECRGRSARIQKSRGVSPAPGEGKEARGAWVKV